MVEGPGVANNGARAQSLVGIRVLGLAGPSQATLNSIRGKVLREVIVVGKELFFIFNDAEEAAIRLHFGMNGSMRLDGAAPACPAKAALALRIILEGGRSAAFYDSTVQETTAAAVRSKYQKNCDRDVCAADAVFDKGAAVSALTERRPTALISDAALDQSILPGVGNIIKNEALHLACIDPRRLVGTLSTHEASQVVEHARAYSLRWKKMGRHPPAAVYNRTCGMGCGGAVAFQKLGNDLSRPTFWCRALCGRTEGEKRPAAGANAADLSLQPQAKRPRSEQAPPNSQRLSTQISNSHACSTHGPTRVLLRRVRKAGANAGRLFFSCRAPSCSHFSWADTDFPRCQCNRVAVLRISKQARSGGRPFFVCPRGEGKGDVRGDVRGDARADVKVKVGNVSELEEPPPTSSGGAPCGYFAWAGPAHLVHVQGFLSPLI